MWQQIIMMVISWIISYVLAPKPQDQKPAALEDFDMPSAEEGKEIGVVFGTVWINSPNVVWYGDLVTTPIRAQK